MGHTERPAVVLYGASGHGKVIADIIRVSNDAVLTGFIDDGGEVQNRGVFDGLPIIGGREQLLRADASSPLRVIVSIGSNRVRERIVNELMKHGVSFHTAVHPKAVLAGTVRVGEGSVIMAGAVVNADAVIGRHCIVNTSCSIDHDCVIADFVHISPGVHMAGGVRVGPLTHIGIGASIRQEIAIGRNVTIGAGAAVVSNMPDNVVAYGVPATIQRLSSEETYADTPVTP